MERLTYRDDNGRALLTHFGKQMYCSTQATADCVCMLEERLEEAISLMKEQQSAMFQGFLTDIPSSESILNSVNCHAISLEDASKIIAICACVCDLISPSGFISWLKERIAQDAILKGCVENNLIRNH